MEIDLDQRRAARVCMAMWALACAIWIAVASVPLRQPDPAALEVARSFRPDLHISIPDGHRIITTWWPATLLVCVAGFLLLRSPRTRAAQADVVRRIRGLPRHGALLLVLVVAFVARAALAHGGGQYFDLDEARYGVGATSVLLALSQADWHGALAALCGLPAEHMGFRIAGLVPALVQTVPAWLNGRSIIEMHAPAGEWVAAATLSGSAVLVIAQVYWLALKLGAGRREALFAATLTACSTTLFMYSRGFFPYDVSLAIGLAALGFGLGQASRWRALACGLLAGFAFLIYNGYWAIVPLVGITLALHARRSMRDAAGRLVLFGIGAAILPASLLLGTRVVGARSLDDLARFSSLVINGDFGEGWRLPWEFFWHAEHGLLVLWIVAIVALVLPAAWSRLDRTTRHRGRFWLTLAGAFYVCLVLAANGLHKFVVYDRSIHPLVPFLCLAAASALAGVFREQHARWPAVIVVLLIAQAASHAAPLFALRYPREVRWWADARFGADLVDGGQSFLTSVNAPATVASGGHRFVLINGADIWIDDARLPVIREVRGQVVYRTPHPRQLFIYQYHGYTRDLRTALRRMDLSVRVLDRQER